MNIKGLELKEGTCSACGKKVLYTGIKIKKGEDGDILECANCQALTANTMLATFSDNKNNIFNKNAYEVTRAMLDSLLEANLVFGRYIKKYGENLPHIEGYVLSIYDKEIIYHGL